MRVYTLTELFSMTRAQLFALHDGTVADLSMLPDGSPDREDALRLCVAPGALSRR